MCRICPTADANKRRDLLPLAFGANGREPRHGEPAETTLTAPVMGAPGKRSGTGCATLRHRKLRCRPSRMARSEGLAALSRRHDASLTGPKGFPAINVGQSTLVPPNSESDRGVWETRLADLKTELASQPVESLKDLLRLGEKVLADTGLDVGAGSRGVAGDASASTLAMRLARARDSLSGSTGVEIQPDDAQQLAADLHMFVRDSVRAVRSGRRLLRGTARHSTSRRTTILRAQGAYYVVSGLWAVVDRRGFETVTGRKTDYWLVRTVGVLAAAIGASLLTGARGARPSPETTVLAVAAGASFTAVDLVFVAKRRIRPVYLADAAVHGLLAGCALRPSSERAA
jgi:hypothetical protein